MYINYANKSSKRRYLFIIIADKANLIAEFQRLYRHENRLPLP